MGPLIVIGFWLIIVCIGWIIVWAYPRLNNSETPLHLRRPSFKSYVAAVAAIAVTFALIIGIKTALGLWPSHVFSRTFGFATPSDVTALHGYNLSLFDSGETYLRFRASQDTINRTVRSKFKPTDRASFGDGTTGEGTPPSYWKPFDGHPTQFYQSESISSDPGYGRGRGLLCYDENGGMAYFSYSGSD